MRDLSVRSHEAEWMDSQEVGPQTMAAVLRDLAQVNTFTLARGPTLAWLARLARGPFTLVDVGAGEGDMLRAIAKSAARRGVAARLIGYDLDARCSAAARAATDPRLGIEYAVGDAMAADLQPDVIVSALVTHHMSDDGIVAFLRWMERTARQGWFVNDLHRNWFAYHGFALLAAIMRWHPFVRHDGALSVARAFRKADWQRLLAAAGIVEAQIVWRFPFRLCVERAK